MRHAYWVSGRVLLGIVVTLVLLVLWGLGVVMEAQAPVGLAHPPHVLEALSAVVPSHTGGGVVQVGAPGLAGRSMAHSPRHDVAIQSQVAAAYGQLPLHFEANQGQSDGRVQFLARSQGMHVFLTATEVMLVLPPARPTRSPAAAPGPRRRRVLTPRVEAAPTKSTVPPVVRLSFVGAHATPQVVGVEELPGKNHYLLGNDPSQWRTNIPTYAKVKYREVYPGVDVLYYGNPRQLEYDVIVAPGADPSVIALALTVDGTAGPDPAPALRLEATGDVVLTTAGGTLRLHQPVVSQEIAGVHHAIPCRYVLGPRVEGTGTAGSTQQLRVQVAAYDRSHPLLIDPVLSYSTYLGGSADDGGFGIAVDGAGNAYVTGRTESANVPTTPGAVQPTLRGDWNVFVSKLNPTGTALVYSTYLGGSGSNLFDSSGDEAWGIAVDGAGNAYVTGMTESANFPTTPGAVQPIPPGGSSNAFVSKLNATGTALVYSTYLGGSGDDSGYGIAVDGTGNAYVTGGTTSANFPITPGAFQTLRGSAFVTKLNATGTALVYSTFLGDSNSSGIAVDRTGNAYVTGSTGSANFPTTPGAFQPILGGSVDAFVSKLNATGTALGYSTYLGGSGSDEGFGIAVDGAGNAYVTGQTFSTNFPTTPGAVQPTLGGFVDAFVSKLNATGTALSYSTYLGGSSNDWGLGIAVDATGTAYVTGGTTSANFPTTPGAVQPTLQDSYYGDAFVSKLNATGTALGYSTYLGGEHSDEGQAIAVDATGAAYVTGLTYSTNFPTTPGAVQPTLGSRYHSDAFVTKLVLGLPSEPALALTVNTPSVHKGETLTLSALTTPGATSATADVYIALQPPGCASVTCLLFWQGGLTFTATPQPLLHNWPISPFNGPLFRYTFDGTEPVGPYVWVGAFTVPGTSTLMGGTAQVPWTFSQ